jgi:hypothetical protein
LTTIALLMCSVFLSSEASAQDDDRTRLEAEMFGAEPVEESSEPAEPLDDEDAREAAMFGSDAQPEDSSPLVETQDSTARIEDALLDAEDRLAIGGFLFMQLNDSIAEETAWTRSNLSAPNLFDLYIDARPNERLRTYARGRLLYDYTQPAQTTLTDDTAQGMGDVPSNTLLAPGVATNQRLRAQLDQLWVKFDLGRKVYVTVGRQRIRWGSGRFWNPTDFLNNTQINPIALFDQRLGVDLLKLHVPLERLGWNFYAIGMLGDAQNPRDLGAALRGEFLLGKGELALSFVARKQRQQGPTPLEPIYAPEDSWPKEGVPLRFGVDLSRGLGPFEMRLEAALTHGELQPFYRGNFSLDLATLETPVDFTREDEWLFQAVASTDLTLNYGDNETLIVAAEYFYNQWGYENSDLYLWLALQQNLRPLYLGQHYAALALLIPSPGPLNDSSFTLSALGNLSDGSFLSRLDFSQTLLRDLTFNAYIMSFFGNEGEFRFRVEVPAIPGQTDEPLVVPPTRFTAGMGLRMSF